VQVEDRTGQIAWVRTKKLRDGMSVRSPGVLIADVCGKEFDEAPRCLFAGARDQSRKSFETGASEFST